MRQAYDYWQDQPDIFEAVQKNKALHIIFFNEINSKKNLQRKLNIGIRQQNHLLLNNKQDHIFDFTSYNLTADRTHPKNFQN